MWSVAESEGSDRPWAMGGRPPFGCSELRDFGEPQVAGGQLGQTPVGGATNGRLTVEGEVDRFSVVLQADLA